jgi:hypothetical protein
MVNSKCSKQNQILFKTIVDLTTQIIYFLVMKKPKIDLDKIIKVKPKMVKEGPDVGLLFVMILGFLLGMVLISLTSCSEQTPKSKEEPIGLRQKSDDRHKNVTEFTYGGCEYIRVGYGQSAWGSHKGNCSNPIHKK